MSIKDNLNNLTGLQRVFLVAFLLCWGYFAFWNSMGEVSKAKQGNFSYQSSIEKDFSNPACKPYATQPMSQLSQPKFSSEGGSCWHIYTHRYYNEDTKLPLTLESYDASKSMRYWGVFFANLGIYSVLVVVCFGLVFLTYKTGKWIYAGFKKTK